MIQYRRLTADDVETVAAFMAEGMQPSRFPLAYSRDKVLQVVRHFMQSENDFHCLAFDGDRLVGVIAAAVAEMLYFERGEAHICALYATKPGVGRQLLRDLIHHMDERFSIRRIVWAHNEIAGPALNRFVRMCAGGRRVDEVSMHCIYKG